MSMPSHTQDRPIVVPTRGLRVNLPAWSYDLIVQWIVMRGRERTFRQMTVDLAQIQSGEAVLDVGCGTGTLALIAQERVGPMGHIWGIDPSASMIAGARRKAARRRLPVEFRSGVIEQIDFPDHAFDVVLSTFMMHHLPYDLKCRGLAEIARVLKPGGRLLVVDFKRPEDHAIQPGQSGTTGEIGVQDLPALMKTAGFAQTEGGDVAFKVKSAGGRQAGHETVGFVLGRTGETG